MKPIAAILFAAAIAVPAVGGDHLPALVLENDALRAVIVPDWGGRLQFFGRPGGANALWTNPAAADVTDGWKNVGGEKTWAGTMSQWSGFKGGAPHPWFDEGPFEVVRASSTNILLRAGPGPTKFGDVAIEREFTLLPDRLVLNEKLLPQYESGGAGVTPAPLENDSRRVWGVAQIPPVACVMARLCGEGRRKLFAGFPAPAEGVPGEWLELDLLNAPKNGRIALDADALSAPFVDGSGDWLLIEQSAPERHLGAFAEPSRAIVYTTGPASDKVPLPYVELEFVALGPDAEQTLIFRIGPCPANLLK